MNPAVYDAMAAHDRTSWYYRGKRAAIRALLQKHAIHTTKVVDIGCGTGRNAVVFEPATGPTEYVGIEPAELPFEVPGFATSRIIRQPMEHVSMGDVGDPADLVAMIDVLEHVEEDRGLEIAKRLLKRDGHLLITVPAYPILWSRGDRDAHHLRRYTPQSLKTALQRHGLTMVSWNHYFLFAFLPLLVVALMDRLCPSWAPRKGGGEFGPWPDNGTIGAYVEFEGRLGRTIHWPWGTGIVAIARFS